LSRRLIDDHETWTGNFRNPFNEALPVVNTVCPFLTARVGDPTNKNFHHLQSVELALLHHQQCWRQPPDFEDGLGFHITFYEIIDLPYEDDGEELWMSGRLHSDNETELKELYGIKGRHIRESACTVSFLIIKRFSHINSRTDSCSSRSDSI
jgi:hypothetical protein